MAHYLLLIMFGIIIPTTMTGCVSTTSQPFKDQPSSPANQVTIKGKSISGTILTATNEQGRLFTLKIASVDLDDQDRDLYLYTVLYQNSHNSQWQNLCQPDRNGIVKAIPLSGQWDKHGNHLDNEQITFACTYSVLAKCVQLGYKPWKTVNGQSLRPYHQACTRMLRGDYCGNGMAHTREGTPIDVYDRLQMQQPTANSGMIFEAAWNANGAVWISRTRYPKTIAQLQRECPQKLKAILHLNQDAPSTYQTLLFNRSHNLQ